MANNTRSQQRAAVRRKQEEKKLAARRAFYKAHQKQIITGIAAAVIAIIVIVLAVDYFYTPGGSIRSFMGNLIGVKDNAVIRQIDGNYYEFATMDAPAGYAEEPYTLSNSSDSKEQHKYFVAQDETKAIQEVYVTGVKQQRGADMVKQLTTTSGEGSYYENASDPRTATIAGHEVNYFYSQTAVTSAENSDYCAMLVTYVDTIKDSSVLVSCTSADMKQEDLPGEEAMVAELEAIYAGLKLPE